MATSTMVGQARTVLGPVPGDALGITLPHEHLLIDFEVMFVEPAAASEKGLAHLLVNVVPRLRRKGLDEAAIKTLLVENPARAIAFA
jgi:predicted metal-dependent phosphotriesterase family hydrolase